MLNVCIKTRQEEMDAETWRWMHHRRQIAEGVGYIESEEWRQMLENPPTPHEEIYQKLMGGE